MTTPKTEELSEDQPQNTSLEITNTPYCPKCQSRNLRKQGFYQERQRYKCRDCKSSSYGMPAFTSPPPPPCIRCGERTIRGGLFSGKQIYRCTACHRAFVPGPPPEPKRLPSGKLARCHHCDSDDLISKGKASSGKQQYKCRLCQKFTYGFKPKPKPHRPCPYCGAQCRAKATENHGKRYLCTTCGKYNTDLWPAKTTNNDGPYPWQISFCLDIKASRAITNYCNTHCMSLAQAIRAILREAADKEYAAPVAVQEQHTPDGGVRRIIVQRKHKERPIPLPKRLPDLRPLEARRRLNRDPEIRHKPHYYITSQASVCLDDKAYTGLLRTMQQLNLTHQQAARYLISETAQPQQNPVAINTRNVYTTKTLGNK